MENRQDTSELTLFELFKSEVMSYAVALNEGLLALENPSQSTNTIESLIRAIDSLYNVALLVEVNPSIELTNQMKACLVNAEQQKMTLQTNQIALLRRGVDLLLQVTQVSEAELERWLLDYQPQVSLIIQDITTVFSQDISEPPVAMEENTSKPQVAIEEVVKSSSTPEIPHQNHPVVVPQAPVEQTTKVDTSMLDLFRLEVEEQSNVLNKGLLALETQPTSAKVLESLMRAAHSVKGAARIVSIDAAVHLAHVMEDCFVAAQKNVITLSAEHVDILLQGVDILVSISKLQPEELNSWLSANQPNILANREQISQLLTPQNVPGIPSLKPEQSKSLITQSEKQESIVPQDHTQTLVATVQPKDTSIVKPSNEKNTSINTSEQTTTHLTKQSSDRIVRVNAENLNRIMGLAGESLIESNWLQPFADSLAMLKKQQLQLAKIVQESQEGLALGHYQEAEESLSKAKSKELECRQILSDRLNELELFARRNTNLSDRLYREVIASNMRPFSDGVEGFPRMIRDLARKLGKQVKFEILGQSTPVDRDILQKLEAPLTHILRNSIDHGIELPADRLATGKPEVGNLRLVAGHRGGMLSINISDDGRGINYDSLRAKIISKGLVTAEMAEQLTENELIEFLFLPGFSTAKQVTEISGRGVGLDIAKSMAQEVGGSVRAFSQTGKGISFNFQLPLTLSVVRTLLVEISGDPYAFPLARVEQVLTLKPEDIYSIENRQYFTMNNRNIGLIAAHQVLELTPSNSASHGVPVVVIGEQSDYYGVAVDRFIGEHDLVVRPLDPALGKIQDINAAAVMGDGSPILIVDVSDLICSVDNLLNDNQLGHVHQQQIESGQPEDNRKSILVVDDSITVREMERKLLQNQGYKVDVAVDGMEGWYTVCSNHYDLIISDIDMPRMNGIELVSKIKNHAKLKTTPIIIVSYKDREEDRISGLEAGADYYLTKASFHDDSLIEAVLDLIGS